MAITFDSASNGAGTGSNQVSFNLTVGTGANKLLVVGVHVLDASKYTCSAVTFSGTSLTLIKQHTHSTQNIVTSIWYLLNPTTASANVVASITGFATSSIAVAAHYFGAAQSGQPEVSQENQGFNTSATITMATLTNNAMAVQIVGIVDGAGTITPASGQTERTERLNNGASAQICDEIIATAGNNTFANTINNFDAWNTVIASFVEAAASGTAKPNKMMMMGVS